jgi:branched-chain amino acid transport system ATP-binding protein
VSSGPYLSIQDLGVAYGNIKAVKGISFDVMEGEIVTLIGANGAGKSSTLRAISGLVPYSGQIHFKGESLAKISADKIVGMGIAQVPEGRGIFGSLTVLENLKLATWQRKDKAEIQKDYDRVFSIFPRLQERKNQLGGTL